MHETIDTIYTHRPCKFWMKKMDPGRGKDEFWTIIVKFSPSIQQNDTTHICLFVCFNMTWFPRQCSSCLVNINFDLAVISSREERSSLQGHTVILAEGPTRDKLTLKSTVSRAFFMQTSLSASPSSTQYVVDQSCKTFNRSCKIWHV